MRNEQFSNIEQTSTGKSESMPDQEAIKRLWDMQKEVIDRGYEQYATLMYEGRLFFDPTYLDEWGFNGISREEFDRMLSDGKILDIGCGKGNFIKDCINRGFDAYGVDLALSQQSSTDQIKKENPEIIGRIVAGDGVALPFEDQSFRTVINIFGVPSYFYDPDKTRIVLEEQLRILDDRGQIIIYPVHFRDNDPYPDNFITKIIDNPSEEVEDRCRKVEESFADTISSLEDDGTITIERHVDQDRLYEPEHINGLGYIIIRKAHSEIDLSRSS
jgi:ubiquinone/menaquinone biosynthesis C-methylase UbiE